MSFFTLDIFRHICLFTSMIQQQVDFSCGTPVPRAGELEELEASAFAISSHPLPSKNLSTKTCLVAMFSILNNVSRKTRFGDVCANGVDPSTAEASVYAWADGIAKEIGEPQFQAILLGAFKRAVETLKR